MTYPSQMCSVHRMKWMIFYTGKWIKSWNTDRCNSRPQIIVIIDRHMSKCCEHRIQITVIPMAFIDHHRVAEPLTFIMTIWWHAARTTMSEWRHIDFNRSIDNLYIFSLQCSFCSYVRSTEDISYISTEPVAMALNRTSSNGTRYRPKSKRNEVSYIHCAYSLKF